MKRVAVCLFAICVLACSAGPVRADFFLWDSWGGTWSDANKTAANTDDDYMCWAATISNMLTWTNWSDAYASNDTDAVFGYYQGHWTDAGGNMYVGADWWFDGTNIKQGEPGWSQNDVPGGGFYPSLDIDNYYSFYSMNQKSDGTYYNAPSSAVDTINDYLTAGMSVGLGLSGTTDHAVTVWGLGIDDATGLIESIFITDSDDGESPALAEYDLSQLANGYWELDGYGNGTWYITEVHGLTRATPIPGAAWLLGSGLIGLVGLRRKYLG